MWPDRCSFPDAEVIMSSLVRFVSPAAVTFVLALAIGCARQVNGPGSSTTTITSGTPGGVRVTGAQIERDDLSNRIADEVCSRELACGSVGDREGARYRTQEACMADQGTKAPSVVSRWGCTPVGTSASFETCLATIRSARCDVRMDRADEIAECRRNAVCAPRSTP
ncbi:MAG: hypothetical protein JST00_15985 [Deltaproteobacteria bacterium]|nr:hypothetical protein [Deltaproteobacteria bacterium]